MREGLSVGPISVRSRRRVLTMLLAGLVSPLLPARPAAAASGDFATWLAGLRQEAIAQGIRPHSVARALQGVHEIPRVLELDRRQPEGTLTLQQYLDRVVTPQRIESARQHLAENQGLLERIGRRYGVQPRFIVALWGLESDFGKVTGDFPVISALATLAYDGRRAALFRRELIAAIRIVDRGFVEPQEMRGSWAGAMGQCQFMPSSYLEFAVSERADGRRDIWHRREDVLASIANYLSRLGWQGSETWGREVLAPAPLDRGLVGIAQRRPLAEWRRLGLRRLDGGELPVRPIEASLVMPDGEGGRAFLAYDNFRSILKWNNSSYFAISVGTLADAIE